MKNLVKPVTGFAAVLFLLSACETTEGFGRDLESAGEAIEESAKDND